MPFTYGFQEHSTGVGVSSFATNLHFEAPNPNTAAFRGELHLAAIVHSPDARLGKEVRELISQRYYSDDERSAFEALTSSLGEVIHLFRQRQIPIELSAVSLVENIAYLTAANGAYIVLVRDGVATTVLSSEESEVKSASGYIQEGDIVILATRGLAETVSSNKLQNLLDQVSDLEELKDAVVDETVGYKKPLAFTMVHGEIAIVEEANVVEETAIVKPSTNSFRTKVAVALDKVISLIPEKKVMVSEETIEGGGQSKSKLPALIGVVLLGGLLLSIAFGVKTRNAQQLKAEYQDELLAAQHQFEESRSLAGINSARAKELILSARQTVNNLKSQGIEDEDLNVLGAAIEQSMGDIAGIYNRQPTLFLDLSLIRADFQGSDLSFSKDTVRVLDAQNERMTLINAGSKKTENIGDLDLLPNAMQTTAYSDDTFILSTDGIREVQNEISLVVKDEDWNADDVLVGAFGGNLYVLDKENNKIWRYPGGISAYGEGQEWFAPGINVDVTEALSWSIDGKVWILSSDGSVDVYERGLPQNFTSEGVGETTGFKQIFTDESAQNVYLLDTVKSRIVVLEKSGVYKGEYQTPELAKAIDFVVSEPDGKIVFLAENKLWEIELQ